MRICVALFVAVLLLAPGVGAAAGREPFHGTWACAMVADNAVNTLDWTQETYSVDGVALGQDGKPEKFKVKLLRRNHYELTYAGGGVAHLVMDQPWLFRRSTLEHSYVCLRKAP